MNIKLNSAGLLNVATQAQTIKAISEAIASEFGNKIDEVKGSIELILSICISIEHIIQQRKVKRANKLELFKSVYIAVFPGTTPAEMGQIVKIVDYLCMSGAVKPKGVVRRVVDAFIGFFRQA